jgi:predicted transposase YbfD/YdcC
LKQIVENNEDGNDKYEMSAKHVASQLRREHFPLEASLHFQEEFQQRITRERSHLTSLQNSGQNRSNKSKKTHTCGRRLPFAILFRHSSASLI